MVLERGARSWFHGSVRFLLGLLLGAAAGAAATYVALEPPGQGGEEPLFAEAGAAIEAAGSAEPTDRRRKRRRRRARRGASSPEGPPQLSAADRAAVWRGPAVALPDRELDFAEGGGGRPLSQQEIDRGVGGGRAALTECIHQARGEAELTAKMTLKFLVDERGSVTRTRVRAPAYLQERGLHECVQRVTRGLSFPATGAATVVTLPFELAY